MEIWAAEERREGTRSSTLLYQTGIPERGTRVREHHGPYVQEWTTKNKIKKGDPLKGNQGEGASGTLWTGMDYKKGDPLSLKGNQGEGASWTLWTGIDYKKKKKKGDPLNGNQGEGASQTL